MSNIQSIPSFSFHNNSIRVQGTPDSPLFCLPDVCNVLALSDPSNTVRQIKEEFSTPVFNTGMVTRPDGSSIQATFITEPQLYFVMMRSRAKVAKAFRQLIVNEVIPAIRKSCSYTNQKISHAFATQWAYREIAKNTKGYINEDCYCNLCDIVDRAWKQGFAIACNKFKHTHVTTPSASPSKVKAEIVRAESGRAERDSNTIVISKELAQKIKLYLDWIDEHQNEMCATAKMMREQSAVLMYMAENYSCMRGVISQSL